MLSDFLAINLIISGEGWYLVEFRLPPWCACVQVAPKIKERMMKEGTMMITYQPLNDLPNFFRLVLQNSSLTLADMDYFVNEIERLGSDL